MSTDFSLQSCCSSSKFGGFLYLIVSSTNNWATFLFQAKFRGICNSSTEFDSLVVIYCCYWFLMPLFVPFRGPWQLKMVFRFSKKLEAATDEFLWRSSLLPVKTVLLFVEVAAIFWMFCKMAPFFAISCALFNLDSKSKKSSFLRRGPMTLCLFGSIKGLVVLMLEMAELLILTDCFRLSPGYFLKSLDFEYWWRLLF